MCFSFAIKKAPANRRSKTMNFICKFEMHPFTQFGCIVSIYGTQASTDTRFDVTTDFWLFTEDRAGEQVENRWNTCYRMGEEGADEIAKILAREAPGLELAGVYGAEMRTVELDLACRYCGTVPPPSRTWTLCCIPSKRCWRQTACR